MDCSEGLIADETLSQQLRRIGTDRTVSVCRDSESRHLLLPGVKALMVAAADEIERLLEHEGQMAETQAALAKKETE